MSKKRNRSEQQEYGCYKKSKSTKYKFDVVSDEKTIRKFLQFYNVDLPVISQNFDDEYKDNTLLYETFTRTCKDICDTNQWKTKVLDSYKEQSMNNFKTQYLSLDDLHVGDLVSICYFPMSQKYIDYYNKQSLKKGMILYIDSDNDDAIVLESKKINKSTVENTIKSLSREGCHFMGMCRGYDYFVHRFDY